jgi:hypothetical protein
MADRTISNRSSLAGRAKSGALGVPTGNPGVRIREITEFAAVGVIARRGRAAEVADILARHVGSPVVDAAKRAGNASLSITGTAPGQWLVANAVPALSSTACVQTSTGSQRLRIKAMAASLSRFLVRARAMPSPKVSRSISTQACSRSAMPPRPAQLTSACRSPSSTRRHSKSSPRGAQPKASGLGLSRPLPSTHRGSLSAAASATWTSRPADAA